MSTIIEYLFLHYVVGREGKGLESWLGPLQLPDFCHFIIFQFGIELGTVFRIGRSKITDAVMQISFWFYL